MEAALWNHVPHVRKLYYQVWEPSDFAGRQPGRDAAVVVTAKCRGATIVNRVEELEEKDIGTQCGLLEVKKVR